LTSTAEAPASRAGETTPADAAQGRAAADEANRNAYGARSRHKAIVIDCQTVGASDKPVSRAASAEPPLRQPPPAHFFKQKPSSLQSLYTFMYGSEGLENQIAW
jgi:hypothetical protein